MACDGRSGLISSWFQHCLPLYELRITSCLPAVRKLQRKVHTSLNASWKICSLAVNGQSFLVIDGYLLNSFYYLFLNLCLLELDGKRLVNNGFSLSSFFLSLLSYLWIGAQFPQEKFLSYGRILTLHYYFLLMCILLSLGKWEGKDIASKILYVSQTMNSLIDLWVTHHFHGLAVSWEVQTCYRWDLCLQEI